MDHCLGGAIPIHKVKGRVFLFQITGIPQPSIILTMSFVVIYLYLNDHTFIDLSIFRGTPTSLNRGNDKFPWNALWQQHLIWWTPDQNVTVCWSHYGSTSGGLSTNTLWLLYKCGEKIRDLFFNTLWQIRSPTDSSPYGLWTFFLLVSRVQLWNNVVRAQSYLFNFFKNFQRFWYHKQAHFFLKTHGKFNSWKVFRSEDINENVSGYGNHN